MAIAPLFSVANPTNILGKTVTEKVTYQQVFLMQVEIIAVLN